MTGRSAKRRRMPTEMKAKAFTKMIRDDTTDEIETDLNSFVAAVVSDLTSNGQKRGVSPVLTGFFASSWKAGLTRPSHNEPIQGKWAKLKKVRVKKGDKVVTELAPGVKPIIEQRHAVPRNFKINKSVFIGNTAKYAPEALVSPKSQLFSYILGGSGTFKEGLEQKIDRIFTDKKPDMRIGADVDDAGRVSYQKLS